MPHWYDPLKVGPRKARDKLHVPPIARSKWGRGCENWTLPTPTVMRRRSCGASAGSAALLNTRLPAQECNRLAHAQSLTGTYSPIASKVPKAIHVTACPMVVATTFHSPQLQEGALRMARS
eukprot:6181980-Amphidinium_carterae.1